MRAPREDNEEMGRDRLANNLFGFATHSGRVALKDGLTMRDDWDQAVPDPVGLICPQAAHIRKVNSRETPNDMGASRASLDRRILRRGLPYGKTLDEDPDNDDRGLLFVSYQTSIERQFEFLNNRWMGQPGQPPRPQRARLAGRAERSTGRKPGSPLHRVRRLGRPDRAAADGGDRRRARLCHTHRAVATTSVLPSQHCGTC